MEQYLSNDHVAGGLQPPQSRTERQMPPLVRRVTLALIVFWLTLVAGLGWWLSQRTAAMRLDRLTASAEYEAQTTGRVMDLLFIQMVSVANMVASQSQVVELAQRYRTDPPGIAELMRQERAARFTSDPLTRKVGDFMKGLSSDLHYGRIYMNNMSDNTVTASNWAADDSIVGMIYSGRTYLKDALRTGQGQSFGIARLLKIPSYFVTGRIEDANDVPIGTVTVRFDSPEMAKFMTGRHIALVVNRQGRVTTASSEAFALRNVAALLPPGTVQPSADGEEPGEPMDIRSLASQGLADQWLIDGQSYLLKRQSLANTQYQLLTLASLDYLTPMRKQHFLMAVLVAATGLALILLSSHAVGQMVMRRQEEQRAAKRTAALNADLNVALTDAKAKDRQKVEVLGYIGHDLRAPLATIRGYSDILLADAPEGQHKLLQTIQRSVKYQLDLIDELLEYAKSELQPLAIHPVPTNLPLLLDDISEYAVALCSQQNNRFHYDAPDQLPRQISADGKRLQQVLLNLLSNAAKFTRDGVITLSVSAQPEGKACVLRFAVRDTGIGLDLDHGVDIFGAFQQVQTASGSAGLGLFITQRIVSAMGSSLNVASASGEGSSFSFELLTPVIGASSTGWSATMQQEIEPRKHSPGFTLPRNAMPDDQALNELASLALDGRYTDIEGWIARHADEVAHAPFAAVLRDLLERFDFPGIHALALRGREHSL